MITSHTLTRSDSAALAMLDDLALTGTPVVVLLSLSNGLTLNPMHSDVPAPAAEVRRRTLPLLTEIPRTGTRITTISVRPA